jgi:hypothetical protein
MGQTPAQLSARIRRVLLCHDGEPLGRCARVEPKEGALDVDGCPGPPPGEAARSSWR